MVEKQITYIVPVDGVGVTWVRVSVRTVRSSVVDFVVQLEIEHHGREYRVMRYDASHGRPHRDMFDANGNVVEKRWMPDHFSLAEALKYAEDDTRINSRKYAARFMEDYLR